jgi:hypothetical protein
MGAAEGGFRKSGNSTVAEPVDNIVPDPLVKNIQVNFCKNPHCDYFGMAPSQA